MSDELKSWRDSAARDAITASRDSAERAQEDVAAYKDLGQKRDALYDRQLSSAERIGSAWGLKERFDPEDHPGTPLPQGWSRDIINALETARLLEQKGMITISPDFRSDMDDYRAWSEHRDQVADAGDAYYKSADLHNRTPEAKKAPELQERATAMHTFEGGGQGPAKE